MRLLTNTFSAVMIALLLQLSNVSAEQLFESLPGTFPGSGGFPESIEPSDLPPAYPEWPERPVRRKLIPPPPGGPYMSSALSEVDAFPADTGGLRDEFREQQMQSPFFEPDMPWPDIPERGRPDAWIPESGEYRFVPEEVVRELEFPARSTRRRPMYPHYPGYRPAPPVRQPGYGYR